MEAIHENNDFIEVNNVRIYPARLEFTENADKKGYRSKFSLQNTGKSISLVRILEPSSKFYKIQSFPRGQHLSAGLKIIVPVEIPYNGDEKPHRECLIPIYINEKRYDYLILLKSIKGSVLITPETLDFGLINAGSIHITKTIVIENKAPKDLPFQVDHSCSDSAVIVEPLKGRVRMGGIYEISVKIFSLNETILNTSFTIKCAYSLTTIHVKGNVINSKLEALHPNTTEHFTLLEFPPTYFGLSSVVNLFIRNYSAIPMMYSTMGEVHQRKINLESIKKESLNFKFFDLYPTNGFFHENETKLFIFQFSPRQLDSNTKYIRFYFCTILMHRFRSVALAYQGDFVSNLSGLVVGNDSIKKGESLDPSLSQFDSVCESSTSLPIASESMLLKTLNPDSPNDFTRIHLYATAELPGVDIIPDEIHIKRIDVNKCVKRVLLLTNKSKNLPIIVQYKKTPNVYLAKETFTLEPSEKLEISVNIQPTEIGFIDMELVFYLMYYDYNVTKTNRGDCKVIGESKIGLKFEVIASTKYPKPQLNLGLKPNYIKEVGKHCQNLKFNSNINYHKGIVVNNKSIIDKNCSDLIAFPNDTQQSIRPYRNKQICRTIFARQEKYKAPSDEDYELNEIDCCFKKSIKEYYLNYIRSEFKKITSPTEEGDKRNYQISLIYKVLCEDLTVSLPPPIRYQKPEKIKYYVPLIPQEMDNIIISPPVVQTGQIANNNVYTFKIKIENNNNIPIRILLKSDKINIIFAAGARCEIDPYESKVITMSYKTSYIGYYSTNLYVIINESAAHTVPILTEVVANVLHISKKTVTFTNSKLHEYVDLTNKLNIPIPFSWVVIDNNFAVEPIGGIVRPKSTFTCTCLYSCTTFGPNETEAQLYCGETVRQKLKLESQVFLGNVIVLDKEIDFGEIPLNEPVMKTISLRNFEITPLSYSIEDVDDLIGLSFDPLKGILQSACIANIFVTAKFPNCVRFNYNIRINTIGAGYVQIPIKGVVIYPDIIITPKVLNFPKMPASAVHKLTFTIKNDTSTFVCLRFDLSEYEDFHISESDDFYKVKAVNDVTLISQEMKTFFLTYDPNGAQRSSFYLPIIINNILGPPINFDTISTKVNYYLTTIFDGCEYITTPDFLPCVKVDTLATAPKLIFSKTFIQLTVTSNNRLAECVLSIKNSQSISEDICIRIDSLKYPVYMEYKSGVEPVRTDCAYVLCLEPNDVTWFRILFKPKHEDFGEFRVLLPVYLHSDNTLKYHCFINIHATYQMPIITSMRTITSETFRSDNRYLAYIEPTPVFEGKIKHHARMSFINHLPNCKISSSVCDNLNKSHLEILYDTKTETGKDSYDITIVFVGTPKIESTYDLIWEIACSCGSNRIYYTEGIVTNCFFSSYNMIFHILTECKQKDKKEDCTYDYSCYPFFPTPLHAHYTFMEGFVEAIETWICTQVYFGQWRYQIPCTLISFNLSLFEPPPSDCLKRQTQLSRIPIIHLLSNLIGPDIIAYLKSPETPTNEIESIKYMYQVYERSLEFLKNHGGYIGYLRPEYLFLYYDYCVYKKEVFDPKMYVPYPLTMFVKDYEDFNRLSRQSWLDFLLQLYKTLYFNKLLIKYREFAVNGKLKTTPLGDFYNYYEKDIEINSKSELHGKNVTLIFSWLEFNYETNKSKIWDTNLPRKYKIDLINGKLNDGIVFAVTLGTYCPYLIPFLQDIYLEPANTEENIHNVTKIVQCLELLNYSFKITIEQIVSGCSMKVFMLAVYLFEILPYMYPKDELTLKTGLSTNTKRKIEIYNENNFPIAYKIIFIGNEDNCFSTGLEQIEVPPKKTTKISINYTARFIKNIKCTLLLSGECCGYRYASNKVITLIGIPDLHYASSTITFTNPLFKSIYFDFTIQSPYKEKTSYKMQQTYDAIHQGLELATVVYHLEKNRITCGRFVVLNETFDFDDNGQCVIHSATVNIIDATVLIWLYFTNENVGDFAVQMVSKVKDCKEREILSVELPKFIDQLRERPDSLFVNIPNRDKLFFNALKTLLVQITKGDESVLWQKITDTPMGINILESLLSSSSQDKTTLLHQCKGATYNVIKNESDEVQLPEIIQFDDECSTGFCKIPLILKNTDFYPKDFDFILESKEILRKRFYTVHFLHK